MHGLRYDTGALSGPERTEEGYLRCWATIARTGIQRYKRADGSELVEYRPESEVGNVDSLSSFAGKAITYEHPPELLNTANTSKYQVGFTDSEIVFDGKFVRVRMTITDADAIASVESGATPEVSAGYQVDLDETPGVSPEGHRYDAVQRVIRGNHVALTRKGRAGSNVKVHLDANDAVALTTDSPPITKGPMAKINIAGAEYEVSEAVAVAYTSAQREDAAEHQRKLDTIEQQKTAVTAERDQLQANLDSLTGTHDELKSRVDSLTAELDEAKAARTDSGVDVDSLVKARLELIQKAQAILDSEFDFAGKSDREVREAVIKTVHGDSIELSERTDAYVEARFDAVIDLNANRDSSAGLRGAIGEAFRADSAERNDGMKSRKKYKDALSEEWKQPVRKGGN
jgi:uncharacterized protein